MDCLSTEGLGDQPLGDLGAVGVRRVDHVDVELEGAPQHALALVGVARLAPDPRAGDAEQGLEVVASGRAIATVPVWVAAGPEQKPAWNGLPTTRPSSRPIPGGARHRLDTARTRGPGRARLVVAELALACRRPE
jgi:hypothetical protein